MADKDPLYTAAINAAAVITAVYTWLERVEKAGGATSISGVAECNAMLKSLRANATRVDTQIIQPLTKAIAEHKKRNQP